ncbi:PKD domain-containing protein [Lentzea atacamensis]|uniref:PKD domain-containing protein n=1 Tax=Lentzea atacamensis TaxID=531938 RepID=UPI001472CF68|nr:PKD domain-containing protein [Lentzea atacamensis]
MHRASDLSEVDCSTRCSSAAFAAAANETYLIWAATSPEGSPSPCGPLRTSPPGLSTWPQTPNVLSDTTLGVSTGDPIYQPLASGTIDLGDGTVLRTNGEHVKHRFTKDGDYRVTVTATTTDGRTATSMRTLKVQTHDVSVAGLSVPSSARAGQTKPIKVSVANTHHDEDATVVLYRVGANSEAEREIGRLTQRVAASAQGRTEFPFAYSYREQDAAAGQVTFRVRAELPGYGWNADDNGDDNEARGATASVRPASTASARIN